MMYTNRPCVELKSEYTKDIIKTIISFANTNGGKIYIGIDDDGTIKEVTNTDYVLSQVKNIVKESIKPDITNFIAYTIKVIDDKNIIIIEVQKGVFCPYYISSIGINPEGVYIRNNISTVPALLSDIKEMINKTYGDNFEDSISINQNLTFNYLTKVFNKNEIELNNNKMKAFDIINDDNIYTNLGFLLSDQCSFTIKLAFFDDLNVFKNRYEFTASVLEQIDLVCSLLNIKDEKNDSDLETDIYCSPVSLKEALINAICHRDYSIDASTLISIFSDRIEMLNIGGLVKGITENDIKSGISIIRNKKLSNIFYRLKLVNNYGTGISKIENDYLNCQIKPEIIVTENTFKIILPNIEYSEKAQDVSESELKIIEFAKNVDLFTRKEIADNLNLTKSTAIYILNKLFRKGIIIKDGLGKNTVYSINKSFK